MKVKGISKLAPIACTLGVSLMVFYGKLGYMGHQFCMVFMDLAYSVMFFMFIVVDISGHI